MRGDTAREETKYVSKGSKKESTLQTNKVRDSPRVWSVKATRNKQISKRGKRKARLAMAKTGNEGNKNKILTNIIYHPK